MLLFDRYMFIMFAANTNLVCEIELKKNQVPLRHYCVCSYGVISRCRRYTSVSLTK